MKLYPKLQETASSLVKNFRSIPEERRGILAQLTSFIQSKAKKNELIELVFICTHNSRRSHISQIWAQAAAAYYDIDHVVSYSGGTEATAFNPRAVKAMSDAGFSINTKVDGNNPHYEVTYADAAPALLAFSKRYDAGVNPSNGFAAIMTCSHADENCPVVFGMEKRISLPYNDPKDFDGTALEAAKYQERVLEIGTEILYAFSQVSNKQ